jgi:hypothetical protein
MMMSPIDRSQFKVHTDERTQLCSAQSFLVVTHIQVVISQPTFLNFSARATELALVAIAAPEANIFQRLIPANISNQPHKTTHSPKNFPNNKLN